jgi:hypothetical protein
LSKTARQALQLGQPPGLSDQDRVEVNTGQFNIRAQSRGGCHRPHHEAQPAPYVDDTQRASAPLAHRLDDRAQQGTDAPAELKLLAQTLQLAMHDSGACGPGITVYSRVPIASTGRARSACRVGTDRATRASSAETPRIAASQPAGA